MWIFSTRGGGGVWAKRGFFSAFCLFLTFFDRKILENFPHFRGRGPGGVKKIQTFFLKASLTCTTWDILFCCELELLSQLFGLLQDQTDLHCKLSKSFENCFFPLQELNQYLFWINLGNIFNNLSSGGINICSYHYLFSSKTHLKCKTWL